MPRARRAPRSRPRVTSRAQRWRARRDDRLGQRMLAAALRRRREPQQLALRHPVGGIDRRHAPAGPRVIVPVLSSTTCRSARARSRASPSLIRIPCSARLPVPTMIAVGVARPSAHGQAMTSTAMAVCQRAASAAAPDPDDQPAARSAARRRSPRHEPRRRPGRPAAGSAPSSPALLDQPDDLRQRRLAADPRRPASTNCRSCSTVPPITRSPARLVDRSGLAGQHRLVDRGPPSRRRRRPAPSRPGGRAPGRRPDIAQREIASSRRPGRRAPSRAASASIARTARRRLVPWLGPQPAAQQDQADDHRSAVEVGLAAEPRRGDGLREEGQDQRIAVCRQRPHRDQGVHVQVEVGAARARPRSRNRRPKTNSTIVAGASNQTLIRSTGQPMPPGQSMTAIITRPMPRGGEGAPQQLALVAASGADGPPGVTFGTTSYPAASMARTIPARSIWPGS